jgi:uncharacterized damage-inducible protein DinB
MNLGGSMYRKVEDFVKAWESESASTQKLLDALSDTSLSQSVVDGHRTLARMAWHIVTTIPEMMSKTGLKVKSVQPDAPLPNKAAAIQKAYASASGELLEQVKSNWTDQTLAVEDEMYGDKWARGMTARILLDHQTHHRGQMTVLMRQAGLKVPGVYGPAKEEWVAHGAPPPEI